MTASSTLRRLLAGSIGAAVLCAASSAALAQSTVKIIVPYAAGNFTDILARQLGEALHKINGNNYVVENKPGASAIIGSTEVNKAKPDGTTLLVTTGGHATNAVLFEKLPYDTLTGFTPISQLTGTAGFALLVAANSPYQNLEQLLDAARAKPGALTFGSAGNGNTTHLVGALFEKSTGTKLVHVPYRGSPINDLMAGHIDMVFWGSAFASTLVAQGKVRALAVAADKRLAELPNIPTLKEKGIEGVNVPAWVGVFGPPGMTPALASSIQRDLAAAIKQPALLETARNIGSEMLSTTPAQFSASLTKDIEQLNRDVKPLGIRMD
ncbi:tripartite tricarboxylate transporter substrate binding protein [Variovorax sp. OV329]|uniref:Bug family tripartite tricarboxylate transporter substrate binding protein n=1 Tax=Variovorax sp. OV329 TaxID=1882825 RepID=UPI0008F16062|nr:tripartite tricarboxylate transporter substrate binding protein [Variovorax sp. OV329]SFM92691.1 Tripartite-type tricarboxylate transporter, receptor component TctC [Variovorax sp. OV329]